MADSLFVLLAAVFIDAYTGAPLWRRGWRRHPLIAIERIADGCVARLDRAERGRRALRVRGAVTVAALAAAAGAAGVALEAAAGAWPALWAVALFVLAGTVDQRESADAADRLGRALAVHDAEEAQAALARLSTRAPVHLDSHGMARVGVEALMRRLSRRWTAPVLYAAFGGVGAVAAYWVIDRVAVAGGGAFGAPSRALRRAARWLPDRLAGLALAAAATLAGGLSKGAVAVAGLRRAAGADWPPAAAAAALGVALGGPRRYVDRLAPHPWIGGGRPQVGPNDIAAARDLHGLAVALMTLAVAVACAVRLLQGNP